MEWEVDVLSKTLDDRPEEESKAPLRTKVPELDGGDGNVAEDEPLTRLDASSERELIAAGRETTSMSMFVLSLFASSVREIGRGIR